MRAETVRRLLAGVIAFAAPACFALTTSELRAQSGVATDSYNGTTPVPASVATQNAQASLQFRGTTACSGLACFIDGPATSASIGSGVDNSALARLFYSFSVVGPPGPSTSVPIQVVGAYATINPHHWPDGNGGTIAQSRLRVFDDRSTLFTFRSLCFNYLSERNEQGPDENCGAPGQFNGSFLARSGSDVTVDLYSFVQMFWRDISPSAASTFLDPHFRIDPEWAATHAGYSLRFDDGVGNGLPGAFGTVPAVPEPETWALFGLGLAALGLVRRRSAGRRALAG